MYYDNQKNYDFTKLSYNRTKLNNKQIATIQGNTITFVDGSTMLVNQLTDEQTKLLNNTIKHLTESGQI